VIVRHGQPRRSGQRCQKKVSGPLSCRIGSVYPGRTFIQSISGSRAEIRRYDDHGDFRAPAYSCAFTKSNESQIVLIILLLVFLNVRFANTINSHNLPMVYHCVNLIVTRLALCYVNTNLPGLELSAIIYANRCRYFSSRTDNADPQGNTTLTVFRLNPVLTKCAPHCTIV
jgi:hypothetical protein